jgi:hypothetical protein
MNVPIAKAIDWLFSWLFSLAFRAKAEAIATDLHAEVISTKKRALEVSLDALKYASQLDGSQAAEAEVIATFKQAVVDLTKASQALAARPDATPQERSEVLSVPFVVAVPFATASKNGSKDNESVSAAVPARVLPGTTNPPQGEQAGAQATAPAKRKRGRPKKVTIQHQIQQEGQP